MTTKYESVLSEEEIRDAVNQIYGTVATEQEVRLSLLIEQATLAKLQPQLDAIGAGGVSGRMMRVVTPTSLVDVDLAIALYQVVEKVLLDIEMCFENFDTPKQAINDLIEWHVSVPKELPLKANPNENPVCYVEPACTIEGMGGHRVCRDGDGFPVYRYPHIPEGYKLVPIEPSKEQINAMRTGSYKDYPSDELCRVRYAAMIAAAPAVKDSLTTENQELRIVFSGEAPNLTFVDVENEDGFSVNAGEWRKRFDGYTELRIKAAKE